MFVIFHRGHLNYIPDMAKGRIKKISACVSVFVVHGSVGGLGLRHVERRKLKVFGDTQTSKFLPIFLT